MFEAVKEVRRKDAKDNETWYLWDFFFGHDVQGHGRRQLKHGQNTNGCKCKTMFIVSNNLTSLFMIWTIILLALHPN
jgi:hypothetical protein